jgi:PAS domain S-box-containing protein
MAKEIPQNIADKSIQDKNQSCCFKEDLIAKIFDSIDEGILIVDQQYMIITANRAYCNQMQMPLQDIIGSYCHEISHKSDKPCYEDHEICPVKETFKTGRHCTAIHTHYNKDNEPVLVRIKSYLVKDNSGSIVFAIEFIENITEIDNLQKELKDNEERFQKICVTAQDAIIIIDNDGKITYWNPASERIFGYSAQEVHGKELHRIIAPEKYYKQYQKGFERFKQTGHGPAISNTLELDALRKNGDEFPIELSISAVKIQGKYNAVGFVRDITERKKTENELQAQKRALEESNTALKVLLNQREKDKQDLEANVLSNVKNLILPAIEKIKTSFLSPQQQYYIDLIENYTKDIVSPFLNKLSSSFFDLTPTEIKIAGLIKNGKSTKEIAELLALSENTVMTHRYKLRSKLGLKNEKASLCTYLKSLD